MYLDDAPKSEDGRPREEGTLIMVWRAVWGMLYTDDVDIASWAYQDDGRHSCRMSGIGLTVSEKKTEAMHLWSHPNTASNALRVEAAG